MTKTCSGCGADRGVTEFYANPRTADGLQGKCKDCHREAMRQRYWSKRDEIIAFDRERYLRQRDRYRRNHASWRRRNPERAKSYAAVSNAIRDGKLHREPCEECGEMRVEAHHDDYSRPLDVRWLCRRHHLEHHGKVSW